jgi:hypothetical protein
VGLGGITRLKGRPPQHRLVLRYDLSFLQGMPQKTGCPQKTALAEEIRVAIKNILELHNAEVERVLAGEFGTREATEHRLKSARKAKALIIDRYRDHVSSHGC